MSLNSGQLQCTAGPDSSQQKEIKIIQSNSKNLFWFVCFVPGKVCYFGSF